MFNDRLAASESGGRYDIRNPYGYVGKYQFGQARLDDYMRATGERFTLDDFQANPDLQERVQAWHISDIDSAIDKAGYGQGVTVGGRTIDRDGLRAIAHLGGIGGMLKYVSTDGAYNPSDQLGTSLSDYGSKFSGGGSTPQPGQPQYPGQQPDTRNALAAEQTPNAFMLNPEAFMRQRNALAFAPITFEKRNSLYGT